MTWFNYNGKLYKDAVPVIGPSSRALRYGDGIFETMAYRKGNIELADDHFARLWKGMQTLQFHIPRHFEPEKLQKEIQQLLLKNQHDKAARIRLSVFRGDGGLYDPADHLPNYIIQTWPLPENAITLNSNGLDLGICNSVRKSCDAVANLKHNNYLPYVMAALEAKKQKWNDAVVLNHHNRICDCTIANIFCIKDEVVYTPALSEGCVAGVMRGHLLRTLPEHQITVAEKEITIDTLLNADEVFITNSIQYIKWVKSIEQKLYTNLFTAKIFSTLLPTIF
ncbi:MAG: aminodeoxychorismate lyase [Bacteroidetes bacterium]|nr:aminodeoxychorismate lyase [Bacteroidota bacterium]